MYYDFRPYVSKSKLDEYDNRFLSKKVIDEKFAVSFFDKYLDLEKYAKKPKKLHDALLINYLMIEVPDVGFKNTILYKKYIGREKTYQKRLSKG